MNKRPIDRRRERGGMMAIDDAFDQSGISGLIVIDKQLHALKEASIYQINLADDVDPKRTNIDIPNSYQRVLDIGTTSPLVLRTLLTAKALLSEKHLPKGFDEDAALSLAFSALKDMAAMHEIAKTLEADQKEAERAVPKASHGLSIPTVGDVSGRFKSFIQKADHAFRALRDIMRLIYGRERAKNFEKLAEHVCHEYGADDPFCNLMSDAFPFWRRVRAARNTVEHPNQGQSVAVKDFQMTEAGQIAPPLVEVTHPKDPTPPTTLVDFMTQTLEDLSIVFEVMLANACHNKAAMTGDIPIGVIELTEEQRGPSKPRFSYAVYVKDGWFPLLT